MLAEWVSLAVSALLILGIAAYLLRQATLPHEEYVRVRAEALTSQGRELDGTLILPVRVVNPSRHTLREVQLEVSYRAGGEEQSADVLIDYLGERSSRMIYVYLQPGAREVRAEPRHYRLE
jgi:uncharacterized protein (TIGR02588 family)